MFNPWLTRGFNAFQLNVDAQIVIALRMMRLASGGARAKNEMSRIVIDKAAAIAEAQVAATTAIVACRPTTRSSRAAIDVCREDARER